jgi:arylsulfatase A
LRGRFGPDVTQEFAVDFVRRHRDRPFLLYYPMTLTHGHTFTFPVVPTPLNLDPNRPHQEMYADMLRYADKLIGDFIAELERLGLRDNTIIVVASDNGTEKSFSARRGGRRVQGGLYNLTEAGGNVALMVNAPKLVPGGRTLPLTDFSDVYPTLCDLAGIPLDRGHAPDGVSFAAFLRGAPGAVPPREWILNEYHTTRVVRDRQFKLYSDGRFFDATNDPEEQHDLAARTSPPLVAARQRLQQVLGSQPPDVPPPFLLLSQSGFKLRNDERAKNQRN